MNKFDETHDKLKSLEKEMETNQANLLDAAVTLDNIKRMAWGIASNESNQTSKDLVQECLKLNTPNGVSLKQVKERRGK